MLPFEFGCINPRSVIATSVGVWFESVRGLELLNRSLQIEDFAGQPVEDTLATYPIITSAVVDEQTSRVYWTCRQTEASPSPVGILLVRDLVDGAWSTLPINNTSGPKYGAMLGTGTGAYYAWLSDAGGVYQESLTSYTEPTGGSPVFVNSSLKTPPIKLSGIVGFQRVREIHLLAQRHTSHGLLVYVDYDNAGTFAEPHLFTPGDLDALTTARQVLRIRPARQKCRAIALQLFDSFGSPLGTGQGSTWIGLRFRVAVKPGGQRLPVANQR
jgi:hypothetical protein